MGAKSEFQKILEEHLRPKSEGYSKDTESPQLEENYLDQIHFNFGPVGLSKPKWAYAKSSAPRKIEIKIEIEATQEKIRVKRKMNFDQAKALRTLALYSPSLNEYSTDEEIKTEYRKLAKIYHPDFNKKGGEIFKVIALAYSHFVTKPNKGL